MRRTAYLIFSIVAFATWAAAPAQAEVAHRGTLRATYQCGAFQSLRSLYNPDLVTLVPGGRYPIVSTATWSGTKWYRVHMGSAPLGTRWVASLCGRADVAFSRKKRHAPRKARATAASHPSHEAAPQKATHLLALSWQPQFCSEHQEKAECKALAPETFAAMHPTLHGLWPQPRTNVYCNVPKHLVDVDERREWDKLPDPAMSVSTMRRLATVMPGVQSRLQRHEWIKHGTCFGGSADAYFDRAAYFAEVVGASAVGKLFAAHVGKRLTTSEIRTAFDQSFGAGAGDRVSVSCKGKGPQRMIAEVRIGLAGDVPGKQSLGDLMREAGKVKPECPGGIVLAVN